MGKTDGKKPLGRPRRRWEYNYGTSGSGMGTWTGSSWLRIGAGGGHL